jgi:hypothetical protein
MLIEICKNLCTLCPIYRPDQGNIVGREYINFYKFLLPYGISLSDSTIVNTSRHLTFLYFLIEVAAAVDVLVQLLLMGFPC